MNQRSVSPANRLIVQEGQENAESNRLINCNPQPLPREHSRSRERAFDELQVNITVGEYARDVVRVEPVEEQKVRRELRQRVKRRSQDDQNRGHWNAEEHLKFVKGNLILYG